MTSRLPGPPDEADLVWIAAVATGSCFTEVVETCDAAAVSAIVAEARVRAWATDDPIAVAATLLVGIARRRPFRHGNAAAAWLAAAHVVSTGSMRLTMPDELAVALVSRAGGGAADQPAVAAALASHVTVAAGWGAGWRRACSRALDLARRAGRWLATPAACAGGPPASPAARAAPAAPAAAGPAAGPAPAGPAGARATAGPAPAGPASGPATGPAAAGPMVAGPAAPGPEAGPAMAGPTATGPPTAGPAAAGAATATGPTATGPPTAGPATARATTAGATTAGATAAGATAAGPATAGATAAGPTVATCPACGRPLHAASVPGAGPHRPQIGVSRYELTALCWHEHRAHGRDGRPWEPDGDPPVDARWAPVSRGERGAFLASVAGGALLFLPIPGRAGWSVALAADPRAGDLVGDWSRLASGSELLGRAGPDAVRVAGGLLDLHHLAARGDDLALERALRAPAVPVAAPAG